MKIKLNPDALTFGDLEDFETQTGEGLLDTFESIEKKQDLSGLSMRCITALLWICTRTENADFTLDDARKIKLSELKDLEIEVAGEADPTPGDG